MDDRGPQLLVIEDAQDQAILVGVAARNTHPGLQVHIAEDGQKGIDYLSGIAPLKDPPLHRTPDLVILDLQMPVVDGFAVLKWLREAFDRVPFPVVVLTASLVPEHTSRAKELGALEVYEKPKSLDQLGAAVREIVFRWIRPGDILAAHLRESG